MAELTVVMATYNRVDLLRRAMSALLAQVDVDLEVVVVDDASTDNTLAYLESLASRVDIPIVVVASPENGGPAVARNRGWRLGSAPYIAFTDDDCRPDPGWARALLAAARTERADVVQGRTIPDPEDPVVSPWNRAVRAESFSHRYQTCNLMVRRSLLEELGGFDEGYPFAGEDADLGWRARARGAKAVYAPDALVLHALRPLRFVENLRIRKGWAELVRFHHRHPESRLLLYRGVFYRRQHLTVLVGSATAAVLASAVDWRLAPALYAAYATSIALRVQLKGVGPAGRAKYAALQPIADLWETGHFAWNSIKFGSLVL